MLTVNTQSMRLIQNLRITQVYGLSLFLQNALKGYLTVRDILGDMKLAYTKQTVLP
jgi:hypothetical protein